MRTKAKRTQFSNYVSKLILVNIQKSEKINRKLVTTTCSTIKYYLARDSGFKIRHSRLKNKSMKMYFKKKALDFRISKYMSTVVLL